MLNNSINEIYEEKAKFARDVEYLKETALDDEIDERLEIVDSMYERETLEDLEEAANMLDKLPADVDVVEEATEVERILNAEESLTFEEMIGIK